MMTMEFDELQKIWDTQNNRTLYAVDEKALHHRILSKKNTAMHITNTSEWLLILVNIAAGTIVFETSYSKGTNNFFLYVVAAWMVASAVFVWIGRSMRMKGDRQFDRTMKGDLDYALSVATYQVRLSWLMRLNTIPIGTLILLGLWYSGKPLWVTGLTLVLLALTYFAGGWEHNIYRRRKLELETLRNKLEGETGS